MIYFSVDNMSYRIKDLGLGFGAFYKLEKPLVWFFFYLFLMRKKIEIKG